MSRQLNFQDTVDAIEGKKWVKFVAMQQNSTTLIDYLNTMKGTSSHLILKV